jgi:hypothetical protein
LNASRQVGAAVGITLLGSFIAGTSGFGSGLRTAMLVARAAYILVALIGLLLPGPEPSSDH